MARFARLALAVGLLLFLPATAHATFTASQVTNPAGPTFRFDDYGANVPYTISGTTTGGVAGDLFDLVCTYIDSSTVGLTFNNGGAGYQLGAGGTFSVNIAPDDSRYWACVMRAIPHNALGPYDAFAGPVMRFSGFNLFRHPGAPNDQALFDFFVQAVGTNGQWELDGITNCGMCQPYPLDPATLNYGEVGANVYGAGPPSGGGTGFTLNGAEVVPSSSGDNIPGFQPTVMSRTFNDTNGSLVVDSTEPVLKCADAGCSSYTDTQWRLVTHASDADGGARANDKLRIENHSSASGTLSFWLSIEREGFAPVPTWRLPGESAYTAKSPGPASVPGSSPAVVELRDTRDGFMFQAVTLSAPPAAAEFATTRRLAMRYERTIPAGGSATVSFDSAIGLTQGTVDALKPKSRAALLPTVTMSAPASTADANVKVTGTAGDDGAISSVTVNGVGAALAGDGTWSATIPLAFGANTVTATAKDEDGNAATATQTVTRTGQPVVTPPVVLPSNVFTIKVAKIKKGAKKVVFTAKLPGPGQLVAKLKSGKKVLASKKATGKAGANKVTIKLSKKLRAKIRKKRKLKAKLAVTFTPTGGKAATKTLSLTLR
jgi:hypothetical protein